MITDPGVDILESFLWIFCTSSATLILDRLIATRMFWKLIKMRAKHGPDEEKATRLFAITVHQVVRTKLTGLKSRVNSGTNVD